MAELEAVFENGETRVRRAWQYPLPLNEPKKLGRLREQNDLWMAEDDLISAHHATLTWDGTALAVEERSRPGPPRNRTLFKGQANPKFAVSPGESFLIGQTVFTVRGDAAADSRPAGPEVAAAAQGAATREELRHGAEAVAAVPFRVLKQLAETFSCAKNQMALNQDMLKVALDALPQADHVVVVALRPDATAERPTFTPREREPRKTDWAEDEFMPSRRLVFNAVRGRRSTVYVWGDGADAGPSDYTYSPYGRGGTPWAICAPFLDGSGQGLYVAGTLGHAPRKVGDRLSDPQLLEFQKTVEILTILMESGGKLRTQESLNRLLWRFIPSRLRGESEENLKNLFPPRQTEVTVLFCDLRGSCLAAESHAAALQDSWKKLSDAIDEMSVAVHAEEGTLAGFQGDAVMAFWGWPHPQPDAARRAARAALRLRERFDRDGRFPDLSCGIGIATGPAIAGRLGAHDLAKVDVFGPCVNLASRLESMTKAFGVRVLLDDRTVAALADPNGDEFRRRKLAAVRPAGMTAATTPSELLLPEHASGTPLPERVRRRWEDAMDQYANGDWAAAREPLLRQFRDDPFAALVLAEMAGRDRPPDGWTGVLGLTAK